MFNYQNSSISPNDTLLTVLQGFIYSGYNATNFFSEELSLTGVFSTQRFPGYELSPAASCPGDELSRRRVFLETSCPGYECSHDELSPATSFTRPPFKRLTCIVEFTLTGLCWWRFNGKFVASMMKHELRVRVVMKNKCRFKASVIAKKIRHNLPKKVGAKKFCTQKKLRRNLRRKKFEMEIFRSTL